MTRKWGMIGGGAVLAGLLVLGAYLLGRNLVDGPEPRPAATRSPTPTATATKPGVTPTVPEGFLVLKDEEAAFSIAYPAAWDRYRTPRDEEVKLLVSPNGRHYAQVRVQDIDVTFTDEMMQEAKRLTDEALRAAKDIEHVIEPRTVRVGGLPAWFYLYNFRDEASGKEAVHAHYFVFGQNRMYVIVFQALPGRRFSEMAPVFDRITESFEPLPAPA